MVPHPVVIIRSALSVILIDRGFGFFLLISVSASFITLIATDSIASAGLVPAEMACALPWARLLKNVSASGCVLSCEHIQMILLSLLFLYSVVTIVILQVDYLTCGVRLVYKSVSVS